MKVIGINGSSRRDGNTAILIRTVFDELNQNGIDTDLIQLPDVSIGPCRMCTGGKCLACMEKGACVFTSDDFHTVYDKLCEADGIVLGSPCIRSRYFIADEELHRPPRHCQSGKP